MNSATSVDTTSPNTTAPPDASTVPYTSGQARSVYWNGAAEVKISCSCAFASPPAPNHARPFAENDGQARRVTYTVIPAITSRTRTPAAPSAPPTRRSDHQFTYL